MRDLVLVCANLSLNFNYQCRYQYLKVGIISFRIVSDREVGYKVLLMILLFFEA